MKILINQKSQVNWQGLLGSFFRIIRYMNQSFFTSDFFYQIGILLAKQCEIGKNHNVVLQFCGEIFLMERTLGRTV
ncbi:MAG: hypothetical protein IJI81_00695 [Lactococcus sp.]|nr:hypothetical protein [Lactococcus sp.]